MILNPEVLYIDDKWGRYCGDIKEPYGTRVENKFKLLLSGYQKVSSDRYRVTIEHRATGKLLTIVIDKSEYERYANHMLSNDIELDFAIVYRSRRKHLVSYQQVGIVNNSYGWYKLMYEGQEQRKATKEVTESQVGDVGDVYVHYVESPISPFAEDRGKNNLLVYEYVYLGQFKLKTPKYSVNRLYTSGKNQHHFLLRRLIKYSKTGGLSQQEIHQIRNGKTEGIMDTYTFITGGSIEDNLVDTIGYAGSGNIYGIGAYIYSSEHGVPDFQTSKLEPLVGERHDTILEDVKNTLESILKESSSREKMSKYYAHGGYVLSQLHQLALLEVLISTGNYDITEELLGKYSGIINIPTSEGYRIKQQELKRKQKR